MPGRMKSASCTLATVRSVLRTEATTAVRLRELLRAELHLSANDVSFCAAILQIPNLEWQDAVEGVLGLQSFRIARSTRILSAAMRIYRELRYQDNLHGVALFGYGAHPSI